MATNIHTKSVKALLEVISGHQRAGEAEQQVIASAFGLQVFPRRSMLLQMGQTAHQLYFVVEGLLHMYYLDEQGQSHPCHFFMPGELATDLESFSKQSPAGNFITAMSRTVCLTISCKKAVQLMQESPAFNKYAVATVEATATDNINRTKDLLSLQPELRYQKLLATRPDIIRAVPLKYIARFLGMSPESLSRIRNRMAGPRA